MAAEPIERWNPGGLQNTPVGAILASAATVAPTHSIHKVSGTAELATITPPWTGFKGYVTFIPTGAWTTTTVGGNIAVAVTAVANRPLTFYYDGILWYPHAIA